MIKKFLYLLVVFSTWFSALSAIYMFKEGVTFFTMMETFLGFVEKITTPFRAIVDFVPNDNLDMLPGDGILGKFGDWLESLFGNDYEGFRGGR